MVVVAILALTVALVLRHGSDGGSASSGNPGSSGSFGSSGSSGSSGSGTCALSGLPAQAEVTVRDILAGGPFAYRQDGVIFDNRERRLPSQPHGYYHEFTVLTPGSDDRGARRIIAGGAHETAPDVLYYTGNHYASFCRVSGGP